MTVAQTRRSPKSQPRSFDVIIKDGAVYDGTGRPPIRGDVGIKGDRIVALGNLSSATAPTVIDAKGLAVAPGFINMLSWSNESLIVDGRSQAEVRQGVTTQIMGEGWSPVNVLTCARQLNGVGVGREQLGMRVVVARRTMNNEKR